MAVGLGEIPSMAPVKGVRVGSAGLGGRAEPRDDLALFELSPGSRWRPPLPGTGSAPLR